MLDSTKWFIICFPTHVNGKDNYIMIDTPGHLRCSVTELSDQCQCKGMGEIKTDQTGIQTWALCISSQLLYELRYLAPVFKPV